MSEPERIQKVLSRTGEYSRRQIERLMDEGKVKVNGVVVREKGIKIDISKDRVLVSGKLYRPQKIEKTYLLFNKPKKVLVTRSNDEERKTIYDYLPQKFRNLKPVGRLDFNSQGALILTNDGDMILKLTHPRYHLPKVYEVKLSSHPHEKQIDQLSQGIVLDGERTLPPKIKTLEKNKTSTVLQMTLVEGKNRQIRRMCEAVGLTVKELRRVSIGPVQVKGLRAGRYRDLNPKEVQRLQKQTSKS